MTERSSQYKKVPSVILRSHPWSPLKLKVLNLLSQTLTSLPAKRKGRVKGASRSVSQEPQGLVTERGSFLLLSLRPLGRNEKKSYGHCLTQENSSSKDALQFHDHRIFKMSLSVFFSVSFVGGRWKGEGPSPQEKCADVFKRKSQGNFTFPLGKSIAKIHTFF